jgi:hypothetical protein
MANAFLKTSRLRLVFDYGVDERNNPIYKTRMFTNIRLDADADDLYATAQAIASLAANKLWAIERNDTFDIDG